MQIGMMGLGRMGANMVRRLMRDGHECVVYDINSASVAGMVKDGAVGAASLEEFVGKLAKPRCAWLMLPAAITGRIVDQVAALMEPGDIIIDGGNSYYHDAVDQAAKLAVKGINFVDVGTSGGVWGLERGYCLMIGGPDEAVKHLDSVFATLAPGADPGSNPPKDAGTAPFGYLHCGPSGAGHFVKMVHNGIEYGLMQAYAEGFEILQKASSEALPPDHRFALNLPDIAEVWRRGSVISSWLLDLTAAALAEDAGLDSYTGYVEDSGEGRWTIHAAVEEAVPADVLSAALYARFRSRDPESFALRLLSAMRKGFGGHVEPKAAGASGAPGKARGA
jgi:6-phosphogluconate dehydrogenase